MKKLMLLVFTVAYLFVFQPVHASELASELQRQLVCLCGCGNMLVSDCECDDAAVMRADVDKLLASGYDGPGVLAQFVSRYGTEVLASPPRQGFNWVAWLLPFVAILLVGILLISRFRVRPGVSGSENKLPPDDPEVDQQIDIMVKKYLR